MISQKKTEKVIYKILKDVNSCITIECTREITDAFFKYVSLYVPNIVLFGNYNCAKEGVNAICYGILLRAKNINTKGLNKYNLKYVFKESVCYLYTVGIINDKQKVTLLTDFGRICKQCGEL